MVFLRRFWKMAVEEGLRGGQPDFLFAIECWLWIGSGMPDRICLAFDGLVENTGDGCRMRPNSMYCPKTGWAIMIASLHAISLLLESENVGW
jgi:hypothetical protein